LLHLCLEQEQNELDVVDRLARAADAASDSELVGKMIMGGDQHWELLPTQAALNVRVGHIARGGIGMPGFPEWLGKYSTKTRKQRLTTELAMHMSLAYSGSFESLRLHYVPVLRGMLLHSLLTNDTDGVNEAIELLDAYGLSKDDFMENMKELQIGPSTAYDKIDSKMKGALTREFNKTAHKSQALVHDIQATKTKRGKTAAPTDEEALEGDAEEAVEEEEVEEEDEDVSMFMKKSKSRASASSGKAAKASSASSSSKAAASSKGKGKARAK
jgi:replication factor C subunit 1